MVELLFENLKEKSIYDSNINKLRTKNINYGRFSLKNLISGNDNNKIKIFNNQQLNEGLKNSKIHQNSSSLILNIQNLNINSNNINSPSNPQLKNILQKKSNKNFIFNSSSKKSNDKNALTNSHKRLIKEKLFPYTYYIGSIFIRNLDISKKHFFFSTRFAKIYIFLCQLYDITSYLALQREFNALKKILNEKNLKIIEKFKKINVNYSNFLPEINDCIQNKKFHILAQGIINE